MKALLYKIGAVLAILFLTLSGAAYAQSITQETDGSWVLSNAAGSDIIILADYGDFTIELGSDESFTYDGKPKKVTSFIITYSEDNEIKQVTDYSIEEDETGEVGHDILYIDNNGGGMAEFWLTYSNNIDVGDNAQVTITNPDGKIIAELTFSIKQAPTLTKAPEAADLTYNGGEQSLLKSAGTATGGTLYYRIVDIDDDFSADLPKAIYAGTYTVEYFVKGSGSYGDSKSYTVDVTINPKELTAPNFDDCDFSKGQNLPVDMEDYEEYLIYFDDAVADDDVYATIVDVKFPEVEEGKEEEADECVVTVTLKLEGEDANNYTLPDAIKKDGDIYADFADVPGEILKTCTVTFDNNGHGIAPDPLVVPVDTELDIDDLDPDMDDDGDYEFVGWFDGDDAVNTYEVLWVNEDITITAHWRKKISPGEIAALINTEKVYDGTTKVDGVVYPQGSPIILKYKGIDLEFSYISYENPNAGTRKITATAATTEYIVNGNQYILPTGEFTVTEQGKITQAPCTKTPDVYAVTESANNAKDGKIVGVDQTMEYRKKDGPVDGDGKPIYTKITTVGSYTDPITSETLPSLDGLAPDTYYVRYAETQNYKPSDDVTVIIEKYTGYFLLKLPDHFEFVTENNNDGNFAMGKKVTFRVSEGYVLVSSEVTTDVTGLLVSKSGVNYSIDMPGRSVEVKATAKADAQFEVSLQGWTYDYEEHIPTIKQTAGVEFTEEQLASIQYYYKYVDEEESDYSTYQPIAAGDYDILAVLEETDETVGASATAKFSISPIVISLSDIKVKGTPSKFYDGNQDVTNLSDLSATINSEILAGDDKLTVKITAGKYPSPERGKYDNVMLSISLTGDEYVVGNYALEYEAIAVNGEIERKYTITFDSDGGTEVEPITGDYGTAIKAPDAPTKEGYTFDGWSPQLPDLMPDGDLTVKAHWSPIFFDIVFDVDGRKTYKSVQYGTLPSYGDYAPYKTSTPEYTYVFKGWDSEIVVAKAAATYTAQFEAVRNTYDVTFVVDGVETVKTYEYGEMPSYGDSNPVKDTANGLEYTFSRWEPAIVAVKGKATYKAIFTDREIVRPVVEAVTVNGLDAINGSRIECILSGEVSIVATDNSGVAKIEYKLNGGSPNVYTEPFAITEPGDYDITVIATDAAGNESEPIIAKMVVRKEATLAVREYTYRQLTGVDVVFGGLDLGGSKVYSIEIDGTEYKNLFVEPDALDHLLLDNVKVGPHTMRLFTSLNGEKHDPKIEASLYVRGFLVEIEQRDINPDGYCQSELANITLAFLNMNRTNFYKIKYLNTEYVPFEGVESLAANIGKLKFLVADDLEQGDVTFYITFKNDTTRNTESDTAQFSVKINYASRYIVKLYDDLIAIDNHEDIFMAYQWYKDGKPIDGAELQYYQTEGIIVGNYGAYVITGDGERKKICSVIYSDKNLSKAYKPAVNAYPNPARAGEEIVLELLNMDDDEYDDCSIRIVNGVGAVVATIPRCSRINTVSLPAGAYTGYVLRNGQQHRASFKLIVK